MMQSVNMTTIIMWGVLLAVGMSMGCSQKEDAQLIREVIQKGAELTERNRIGDLLEHASQDFIALPGRYNKRTVKGVLFAALRQYGRFEIHYPRPVVTITPGDVKAEATIYFMIVRQDQAIPGLKELYEDPQGWLEAVGEKADLYHLKLEWIKGDGRWFVREARIQGFRGFSG